MQGKTQTTFVIAITKLDIKQKFNETAYQMLSARSIWSHNLQCIQRCQALHSIQVKYDYSALKNVVKATQLQSQKPTNSWKDPHKNSFAKTKNPPHLVIGLANTLATPQQVARKRQTSRLYHVKT
jgi:hypothetical protein